ncbi:outer membrane lipoprotein LolB [Motiliproteus coralliicola]|uniref:Outer-membrane lipoprotein LolB n=1 Tax=Motiliproteus coralliicola TaxID=2283196 RepID=A0A369WBY5_9GAMM|nr:lipoprotein insertase outer membrane protein LolB [Motiliproteus coralliicola]RDE18136.1 outer membrane lipoprotein LolB [Motiliproteus coralliicola]
MNAIRLTTLALLVLLAGCGIQPQQPVIETGPLLSWQERSQQLLPLSRWTVLGKVSIRNGDRRDSASLNWSQNLDHYRIFMAGPLGQGAVNIEGSERLGITLEVSGEGRYHADSPEQLLQQRLGWSVPVSQMPYWIRGLPAPEQAHIKVLDNYNRLERLHQGGWDIRYLGYQQQSPQNAANPSQTRALLPRKIELRRGNELRLLMVLKQWQLEPTLSADNG